jgi:putative molybdopterin biosynthesis protein
MFPVSFHYAWLPGQPISKSGEAQLFAMLEGIVLDGSLRAAVQKAGLSYRYAWGLIGRWEKLFGEKLVVMTRGRGTTLTPFGEKLLWAQKRVQARLAPQFDALASEIERELAQVLDSRGTRLTLAASHDLALGSLRDWLGKHSGPRLDIQFQGSEAALAELAAGRVDLAGFHHQGDLSPYLAALKGRRITLIRFVTRTQGLIVAAGNPLNLHTLTDVAKRKARFINRQAGSGTRLAVDQMLTIANIRAAQIRGYEQEEFTHLAVAATVASGHADVGFGIEAAAHQFGLGFVPLLTEQYDFACQTTALESEPVQKLISALEKSALKNVLRRLPGYGMDALGQVFAVTPPAGNRSAKGKSK